jgi:branched-chain amino acid transport system substrate-binding protein
MKRGMVLICLTLLGILLLTSSIFSQTTQPPSRTSPSIKIGGSLPLTGVFSETAKWIKGGYDFWVEDINKRGGLLGRPVQMTVYDDESSAEKAITYYERAMTFDKVDLLSGGYPATTNVALMPLVEKYGKVFVGMGGQIKSFQQGYSYSFASPPLIGDWAYIGVAGILDDLIPKVNWPKSIAFLTANNVTGLSVRESLVRTAGDHGVKVVVDEIYNLPLSDAAPLVGKARGRGAEILCCLTFFDDGVMITRAAKAINYNPKLIFQLLASTIPAWRKELGEDGNNVLSWAWWDPRLPFSGNEKINEAAKARFKIPTAPMFFGLGYCWMNTLELAVQGAMSLDNVMIRDYLRSRKFDLPYGNGIVFNKAGLPSPFIFINQFATGQIGLVWPKKVATTKLIFPRPSWTK